MKIAKVKKYFKNAEKCSSTFGQEFIMNEEMFDGIHKDGKDFYTSHGDFCLFDEFKGFAKILTTKQPSFSITKDQIRQLTDPKVKEWFPEVFEVKLEVGKWYRGEIELFCITKIENNIAHAYGFQSGIWKDKGRFTLGVAKNEFEATEQEVFEALKNEAVKRGYEQGNFECVEGRSCDNFGKFHIDSIGRLISAPFYQGGKVLFSRGKWATIIQTITKSEAEKLLNKKIID